MHAAIRDGDVEEIRKQYHLNQTNKISELWTETAAKYGTRASIETLFKLDPLLMSTPWRSHGRYPIHEAAAVGNLEAIETLHRLSGKSIEVPTLTRQSETPITTAVRCGQVAAVKLLKKLGASIKQRTYTGDNLLSVAVHQGTLEMVKLLCELKKKWPMSAARDNPYPIAARHAYTAIIRFLFNSGYTNIDANCAGLPPMMYAILAEKRHSVVALHALGSNAHFISSFDKRNQAIYIENTSLFSKSITDCRKLAHTLYYSRSLTEILFFAATEHHVSRRIAKRVR